MEEMQAREDLREELELNQKKFTLKLDKIRALLGVQCNLENLLTDEPDQDILATIALHREAKERVKFNMKVQAE